MVRRVQDDECYQRLQGNYCLHLLGFLKTVAGDAVPNMVRYVSRGGSVGRERPDVLTGPTRLCGVLHNEVGSTWLWKVGAVVKVASVCRLAEAWR
jgi:hypothetical protein